MEFSSIIIEFSPNHSVSLKLFGYLKKVLIVLQIMQVKNSITSVLDDKANWRSTALSFKIC